MEWTIATIDNTTQLNNKRVVVVIAPHNFDMGMSMPLTYIENKSKRSVTIIILIKTYSAANFILFYVIDFHDLKKLSIKK